MKKVEINVMILPNFNILELTVNMYELTVNVFDIVVKIFIYDRIEIGPSNTSSVFICHSASVSMSTSRAQFILYLPLDLSLCD